MPITIIDKLKQKNNANFKIADSKDIEYKNESMNQSSEVEINNVEDAINYLYNAVNTLPVLSYVDEDGYRENEKKYWSIGDQMRLVFNFQSTAPGKVTITILRNGFTYKTFTSNKGLISVDLGKATTMADYTYTISAIDSMGRDSNTITFHHILGGVSISSTFNYIIQNTIFSTGRLNNITVPCSISYAEAGFNRAINYTIKSANGEIITSGKYECGKADWSSSFIITDVDFQEAGTYSLELDGEVSLDDIVLKSETLIFRFAVIPINTIAITITSDNTTGLTTSQNASITYRVITDVAALSQKNALSVRCVLYKDDIVYKNLYVSNVTSGDTITWSIGRLIEGNFKYEIIGEPSGGATDGINYQFAEKEFAVEYEAMIGSDYEKQNLIAYFDANDKDNNDSDPSVWLAKNSNPDNYYYIKLHDLNYNKNGWIVDDTDGSKMLKFTGDSYGEMRSVINGIDTPYSPMSEMTSASSGNTFEIVFKSRGIGVSDACVMSCRNEFIENYGGYSLYFDGAKISSNEKASLVPLVEEKETHVVFVIDKNIRKLGDGTITNSNIEDANTVQTMNIYVNGVRTRVVGIDSNEQFANTTAFPYMPLILNAYQDMINNQITGFGACEIKLIRMYNSALTASQVLGNYINSKYDIEVQRTLIAKNDVNKADIPVIRFVRNKVIDENNNVRFSKYSVDKSFEVLNSITIKSSSDKTIATSKNSWVNCTMWYSYIDENGIWKTAKYNDVDVYLQGTSSLQFPIKNYKIKAFNSNLTQNEDGTFTRGKKLKFIPPNKGDKDGWHFADSTYTLKCDYMEQSHKNNTPTAMIYEEILDNVITTTGGDYTPAKRPDYEDCYVEYEDENGSMMFDRKYRDAIAGFPVLLYYNENDDYDTSGTPTDYNVLSTEEDGYYVNNSDVMVGTLMFNIDKTGKALGFEIPEEEHTVESPIANEVVTYTDGTEFKISAKPCISLEGASNSAKPSAASWYPMDEANMYTYEEDYLKPQYNLISNPDKEYEEFYASVQDGQYPDYYTYEQYCELPNTGIFKNIYDYISASFEGRWLYTEELIEDGKELSDDDFNELTYGNIIKTIEWLSEVKDNESRFRSEFKDHFSLAYCITAYLQMMMFIQVDNAGKNAMYDEWGDGIIYPRPYDMDTQMSLNNSGDDVIHISAEINPFLSPTGITGPYASQAWTSNQDTDKDHLRYIDYNTPNSRLWNLFGKYFRSEIVAAYTKLRNDGIYNSKHIVEIVNSLTSDVIGESFYNKDASAKYLSQTYYEQLANGSLSLNDAMLTKLNGNRDSRYEQVFNQRIIFLDTFFGYTSGDTDNTSIILRSDAVSAGNSNVQIGISVYSPGYITIAVGTDVTIVAYVDGSERYNYSDTEYEGVLFNLPIVANNKDIIILGAGNIKSINHMENLVVTNFICNSAKKLTSIVITNSTALASLSLGANTYLRTLNLSGSKTLAGNLNLTNCENLQTIDISDTSITSVSMPTGGSLKSFVAENCALTSVSFSGLQFLEDINIEGCNDIISLEMIECPKITELNTSGYINLNKIVVSSCENMTALNLSNTNLAEMSITACDKINSIDLSSCNGKIMNNLNLTTVYGLKNLNISSSQPSGGIVLSLPLYKKEYSNMSALEVESLINSGVDVYWRDLSTFNANASTLKNITYGVQTSLESGYCDFAQLTNLSSLNIQNCQNINKIANLKYTGNVSSLFYNCQNLTSIAGTLNATGVTATNLFWQCYSLNDISNLITNFNTITNASYMFARAKVASYEMMKQVLDCMPNVTNVSNFALADVGRNSVLVLQSAMFENTPKITNTSYAFRNANITSVPSEFLTPIKNSLTNVQSMFHNCISLTTVPNNLFKECIKLTNVNELFRGCSALVNLFNGTNSFNIFPDNSSITSAYLTFYGCTALKIGSYATNNGTNGLKKMFDNLPNLTDARAMFYNTRFITGIPELIFEKNTKLTTIDAMFTECTSITSIPSALFSSGDVNTITHPSLTSARGLFSGCTALAGTIQDKLLGGVGNLTNIGHINAMQLGLGPTTIYSGGMFANTALIGYAYNFLSHLTKLTSVSMIFFKGSCNTASMIPSTTGKNNNALTYVYIGSESYPNRIYNELFYGLTALKDVRYAFSGNTSPTTFVNSRGENVNSPTLFKDCKNTLTTAEGLFAKCTNLAVDVPRELFQNCKVLTNLRSCYADCISLSGSIPSDFLLGCIALLYTNYMFYRCSNVGVSDENIDISIPSNIFDSCRTRISNVAYMFAGCGFNGQIESGEATQSIDDNGVITYNIIRNGLLSGCTNLTTAEGMFRGCKTLKGSIPEDMFFTPQAQTLYNRLASIAYMFDNCFYLSLTSDEYGIDGRNKLTIYGDELTESDNGYLVPQNWLNRCPALTNITYLFNRVAHPQATDAQFIEKQMELSDLTFNQQTKLQNVSYAFAHVKTLHAALSAIFMQNSLNTITNAEGIFCFSNLHQAGAQQNNAIFEKNTSATARNTVLNNLNYAFYQTYSNNMSGYGPSPNKFTALNNSNGIVYNQTKLANFNVYSANQKANQNIYDISHVWTIPEYNYTATLS